MVNYGPFSAALTLPIPDQYDFQYWTRWAVFLVVVLAALLKLFKRCCSQNHKVRARWITLVEGAVDRELQQEQKARHDEAVAERWTAWNRLGRDLRANRVALTWGDWNRLGAHIRQHVWHLQRQIRRQRQQ